MKQIPILAGILIGNLLLASAVAGQDTAYINRLNNSAFNLRVSNPDSADQLAREALQLSETPAYWHGIGSACQVLGLIAKGLSNQAIAQKLNRSERTVEHHVSAVLAKLNARTRMDVLLRLHSEPWLLPDTA